MASVRSSLEPQDHKGLAATARCPEGVGLCLFDLDGTILDHVKGISPRVVAGLQALREAGVATAVCSGRPRGLVRGCVTDAGCMDYFVTANGACVTDKDLNVLIRRPIPQKDALALYERLKPLKAFWRIHTGEDTYAEMGGFSYMAAGTPDAGGKSLVPLVKKLFSFKTGRMPAWHNRPSALPGLRRATDGVEKMDCSFPSPENMAVAERIMEQQGIWEYAEMGEAELEVTLKGVTKGTGAEVLASYLGVPIERTVSFGDGGNDLPLIGHVGHFVAMGNATPELKEQADEECPTIEEDGVAVWIEQVLAEAASSR